jgi:hypothetical protein
VRNPKSGEKQKGKNVPRRLLPLFWLGMVIDKSPSLVFESEERVEWQKGEQKISAFSLRHQGGKG